MSGPTTKDGVPFVLGMPLYNLQLTVRADQPELKLLTIETDPAQYEVRTYPGEPISYHLRRSNAPLAVLGRDINRFYASSSALLRHEIKALERERAVLDRRLELAYDMLLEYLTSEGGEEPCRVGGEREEAVGPRREDER